MINIKALRLIIACMCQGNYNNFFKYLKTKNSGVLTVAAAFFIYELYLLLNSFSADYQIYSRVTGSIAKNGFSVWPIYWLTSELVGEVGLIVRFAGACFFLGFALVLFRKKEVVFSFLRKAILLEAIQYLFFVPFISYLLLLPNASSTNFQAALSYSIQLIAITPVFIILFTKLRRPNIGRTQVTKWLAIAAISFMFALWIKHFIFSFYALPVDFSDPILIVGSFNSAVPMFAAALILLLAFLPIIQEKECIVDSKAVGAALVLVGGYFAVYLFVSLVNAVYMSFLALTELWAVSMLVFGVSLLMQKNV